MYFEYLNVHTQEATESIGKEKLVFFWQELTLSYIFIYLLISSMNIFFQPQPCSRQEFSQERRVYAHNHTDLL